jgi:hypothetical protein
MKKMLLVALLGLGLVLASEQRASAWSKYNFGVGLNVGYEGGGNSVLFGMFKGEQPPMGMDHGYQGGPEMPIGPGMPSAKAPQQPAPKAMPASLSRAAYYQQEEAAQEPEAVGNSVPSYYAPSYWYGR